MAESNFVDYVKIYCRWVRAGEALRICVVRSMYPMVALTVVMAVEEVMLFCGETVIIGHCFT